MAIAVELPSLGESVIEGTVSRWLVKEGDHVAEDQPLLEVTTDKVDAEIPAPAAGVVVALLVNEGETIEVGTALLQLDTDAAGAPAPSAPAAETSSPVETEPERIQLPPLGSSEAAAPLATPLARRAAAEHGVPLEQVEPSGTRIRKHDVEQHAAAASSASAPAGASAPAPAAAPPAVRSVPTPAPAAPSPPPRASAPAPPASASAQRFMNYQLQPGDKVVPMTPLRRIVAEHMVASKRISPHVGAVAEVDMGGVAAVRDAQKRAFRDAHGFALSYLPFLVHAAVRALREFPRLNASVVDDAIVEKKDIHMGIAVETDKGLVVPVVRHADRLSLAGLAEAIEDLASRARSKKLSPDELKGGSFTLSNPGRHGNLYGFAIINQPQVGILRMGEIVKRPVVRTREGEDAIVIRPIMHLALSYDHRAVDGAPANGFLHRVRGLIEEAEFDL